MVFGKKKKESFFHAYAHIACIKLINIVFIHAHFMWIIFI